MKKILILIITLFSMLILTNKVFAAENPISYSGSSVIYKNTNSILLNETILQLVRPNFKSSNEIAITIIEDNYTGNGTTIGDYIIKLKATDGTNELIKDLKIFVLKVDKFNYYFDKNFYVFESQFTTKQEFLQACKQVKLIPDVPCNANVSSDFFELEEKEETVNVYTYDCSYISATGLSGSFNGKICLSDEPLFDNMDVIEIGNNDSTSTFILSSLGIFVVILGVVFIFKKSNKGKRLFK